MAFRDLAKHPVSSTSGVLCGLLLGVGILLVAVTDRDGVGAVLIVLGFVAACLAVAVAAALRRAGEPF